MATPSGVWGIDLGQCALKALRLEMIDDQLTATAFDYVEHPKILSQPDADPDQLTREALEKFLSRNSLKGDLVGISVPGQSGLARFVKLPPVEEKKIVDIVKFEAKQQIPFNLDEVVWDYQKIGAGTVEGGFALDTEIGLFAIKRDMVNRYLTQFKDVNIEVHLVQMAPLALCNFVAYDLLGKGAEPADTEATTAHGKKSCVVALDIGTDASNLVITDGERIIWQRPIPLGGNHFTRALTKDLKLTFAKAEHLKRNATRSVDKNIDLKKILASLKPVLNDFVGEVQRSLGYFTNTHRDAQVEYMVGLGNAFRLPGLQKFLSEKLGLQVKKLQKLQQVAGDVQTQPVFTDNVLSFAAAYGLALQGLKLGRIQTNLLPHEIRVERLIRAKKPWAVSAAAALLLGTAGCAISYALEYQAYTNPKVVEAMAKAKQVQKDAEGKKGEHDKAKQAADAEEKAVKSVIAGQEERLNWLALNRFITECLPRPDPDPAIITPPFGRAANLSNDAWTKYVDPRIKGNENVANAFARFRSWRSMSTSITTANTTANDADWMKLLVLVNIEGMDCRYADNLATFWDNLKGHLKDKDRFETDVKHTIRPRPADNSDVPAPEGAGWVVELRGYTYHRAKKSFVLDTLLDNLAHVGSTGLPPGVPAPAAPAAAPGSPQPPAEEGKKPKNEHPVAGRVSHVLLLRSESNPAQTFINQTTLDLLMKSPASSSSGGPGQPTMPGGGNPMGGGNDTGTGRDRWISLNGEQGSGTKQQQGGFAAGGNTTTGGSGDTDLAKKLNLERTEFVILFIWKEDTPSEGLMKPVEAAPSTPSQSGGPPGFPGGPGGMPPGGMPPGGFPPGAGKPPGL